MTKTTTRYTPARASGSVRVFADDEGRLWSAALDERNDPSGALVFRCISDGRQSVRALAVEPYQLRDALDDALRVWLHHAPRIGILS